MGYLRNAWYVAAREDEIADGALFSRTILSEPVLLYRTQANEIVALGDRCPHRFVPLHLGKLIGEVVQCGYHGLCFGPTVEWVSSPHGDGKIPRGAVVRRYPTVQRDTAVWIWPGDPAQVDLGAIPDYSFLTDSHPNAVLTGYLPTACDYRLASDNIMDLTHADYLHIGSLGTQGAIAKTKANVRQEGQSIHCDWWLPNSTAIDVFKPTLANPESPVDAWFEVRWDPPALMLLRAGVTPAGRRREEGADVKAVHLMTPETESTTHYFFGSARDYDVEDAGFNRFLRETVVHAFRTQDKPMLEAQQPSLGSVDLLARKPIALLGDAGGLRVRGALERLLAVERECTAT
jgi:vanillate O-demethylase monooxygenase subunit